MKKSIFLFAWFVHYACFAFDPPQKLVSQSQELMMVTTPSWNSISGQLQRFERDSIHQSWKAVGTPIPVVIGKQGMGWDLHSKKNQNNASFVKNEGDDRTPIGVYSIGPTFGFDEKTHNQTDYFPLTNTSVCVDDSQSNYYNQLIDSTKVSPKDWNSGEQMREVPQYQMGAMVQYNTHPTIRGAGSCIFLHIWKGPTAGTAGCIAMDASNLKTNLDWLNSKKNPVIVIFPMSIYPQVKSEWKLPTLNANHSIANYFDAIQNNPKKLAAFIHNMPKGADLHIHLGGASMAENMIHYGKNDNLCVNTKDYTLNTDSFCMKENFLATAPANPSLYNGIIDAWSMRNFKPGKETGHDHFFSTFIKFEPISSYHGGEMLAEVANRAASENELYLELMVTPDNDASGQFGKKIGWDTNLQQLRQKLLAAGLNQIVTQISQQTARDEQTLKTALNCGTKDAKPGCNLTIRYLYQVLREQAPEAVFAQLLAGFEVASKDSRFVGINMVQPEDGKISMRDYNLHMKMVGFLHQLYPNVSISLHAGELVPGLVPAEGLRFHIRNAVEIAHAQRIGHGVDITHETDKEELLNEMAQKHILVEINLSSNAAILNVEGKMHPILLYMQHNVPVALSTDDEGVLRINLDHEYERAVRTYHFSYATLKNLSRNSLYYSFLPGPNLWVDDRYLHVNLACENDFFKNDKPSQTCQNFLNTSTKATQQWLLEQKFHAFEDKYSGSD